LANRFPEEVKNISVAKEKPANISGRVVRDEFGKFVPVVDFGPGVTPQQVYDYTMEMNKRFGINPEAPTPEPGAGTPKIIGKGPAAAQGAAQVSRFGGTRAAASPAVATQATAPIMGIPTAEEEPSIWNTNVPGFERGYGFVPDMPAGGFKPTLKDVTPTMPTVEGIRQFLGPLVQMASRSTGELAPPIPTRRSSEMFADPEAYKQYLRKQMGGY